MCLKLSAQFPSITYRWSLSFVNMFYLLGKYTVVSFPSRNHCTSSNAFVDMQLPSAAIHRRRYLAICVPLNTTVPFASRIQIQSKL